MENPTSKEQSAVQCEPDINKDDNVDVASEEAAELALRRSGRQRKPPTRHVEIPTISTNSKQPEKSAPRMSEKISPLVVPQKEKQPATAICDGQPVPQIFLPPFRLVDLNVLAFKLWCNSCSQPLSLRDCVEEYRTFYKSELKVGCPKCFQITHVPLTLIGESGNMSAYGKCSLYLDEKRQLESCSAANYAVLEPSSASLEVVDTLQECEILEVCSKMSEEKAEEQAKRGEKRKQEGKENETDNTMISGKLQEAGSATGAVPRKKYRKQSIQVLQDEIVPALDEVDPSREEIYVPGHVEIVYDESDKNVECGSEEGEAEAHYDDDSSESEPEKQSESDDWEPDDDEDDDEDSGDDLDSDLEGDEMTRALNKTKREIKENCLYCPLEFDDIYIVSKHMAESHPAYLKMKCGMCKKKFKRMKKFRTHIRSHRQSLKNVCCELCGKFMTKESYQQHITTHTTDTPFECKVCSAKVKSAASLKKHMDIHNNYKCDFCKKPIRKKTRLVEHMKLHIENKTYDCDICGAKFMHKDNMKTHRKNNHTYVCLVCFKSFNCNPKKVEKHAKEEHSAEDIELNSVDGKPYERVTRFQCKTCHMYLATKQSLQFHELTHNKEDKPKGKGRAKKGKGKSDAS